MRLYDDRKGTMYDDFNIRDNESNVFIVDKKGVVTYRKAGRLNDTEIDDVMKLIQKLSLRK
jgi:predicted transcriptional regulator